MTDPTSVTIKGKNLDCMFCKNDKYYVFDVKLNTLATTFFSGVVSMFAKDAKAFVCPECGYVHQFVLLQ